MKKSKTLLLALLCLVFYSCGEYELLEHRKECQRLADSTYKAEIKNLTHINDSICKLNYEQYYQASLDSLIPARKTEIKNLIGK